jgi:hypothetical protein
MFKYSEEKVFVPTLMHYQKFLATQKHSGSRLLKRNKIKWLRTLVYSKNDLTQNSLYRIAKNQGLDFKDSLIRKLIGIFKEEVKTYNETTNLKDFLFFSPRNYVWDENEISKVYKNKKEAHTFKRRIVCQNNNITRSKIKEMEVLNIVQNNPLFTFIELVRYFEGKISRKTILKIVRENNLQLNKQSKSFRLIEEKLDQLFKFKIDNVNNIITYDLLANAIGVKKLTLQRYLNQSPDQKARIESFNRSLRERIKQQKKKSASVKSQFDF